MSRQLSKSLSVKKQVGNSSHYINKVESVSKKQMPIPLLRQSNYSLRNQDVIGSIRGGQKDLNLASTQIVYLNGINLIQKLGLHRLLLCLRQSFY